MAYRKCPDCGAAFIEHRRYEVPERCPRCWLKTDLVVELIRKGHAYDPPSRAHRADRSSSSVETIDHREQRGGASATDG
jgi:Zn-finger nucleic acid-binding protein